ncbi:MAG: DUF333 domain-containing protein [Ardenticatenia bacterium]|nr:DUF333 domain-containing protein [Ardenticatenia bacterium]
MKRILIVTLVLVVLIMAACGPKPTPAPTGSAPGLPNPASGFCADQGHKVEIRTEADGEVGYCIFPDGSECEEWAFYRGECAPGTPEP